MNANQLVLQFANLEQGKTAADLFSKALSAENQRMVLGAWFNDFDNVIMTGKLENKSYVYFLVYETESYLITAEADFPQKAGETLEDFYKNSAERIMNAALDLMLAKVKSETGGALPTQMAPDKRALYTQISRFLVTEAEANAAYLGAPDMFGTPFDGAWALQDDYVDAKWNQVCRKFEDRTNEDAPLVAFGNCVFIRPDFKLADLKQNFKNAVELKSEFDYPLDAVFYGGAMDNGHTNLNGYVLQGDKLFYIWIDSRTKTGQTPAMIFKGFNDRFIYDLLMKNLEHSEGG